MFRQLRVVQSYSRKPWHKFLVGWYPPMDKYTKLLNKLRGLGLYRDEHLVSWVFYSSLYIYCMSLLLGLC